MKGKLSPVAYPTTKEQEYLWGFDVYKPERTPMAWLLDWSGAYPGYSITDKRLKDVLEFRIKDLTQLTMDDVFAGHSGMFKLHWHTMYRAIEEKYGVEAALDIARGIGHPLGKRAWSFLQQTFGKPVPLDKVIWYQEYAHFLYGPDTHAYSWTDGKKAVACRAKCLFRPTTDFCTNSQYCMFFDDWYNVGYMDVEPDLLVIRSPSLGPEAKGPRCMQMWTYDKSVVENLPKKVKDEISPAMKERIRQKGVKI